MKALLLIVGLAATLPLGARTFTSADGSRTMEGELISYRLSNDTVVFRIKGRSARSTAKASAFSKKDQEYFKEFAKEQAKRDSLKVTTDLEGEKFESGGGLYSYKKSKEFFRVSVANKGDYPFEGLTAKYDIYVSKYGKDGKKKVAVVSGEKSIGGIRSQFDARFETKSVEVTLDCSTSSSCPKCAAHASSVKRERVIGLRVRVYNDGDELLSEYYSNNNAETVAAKLDRES